MTPPPITPATVQSLADKLDALELSEDESAALDAVLERAGLTDSAEVSGFEARFVGDQGISLDREHAKKTSWDPGEYSPTGQKLSMSLGLGPGR